MLMPRFYLPPHLKTERDQLDVLRLHGLKQLTCLRTAHSGGRWLCTPSHACRTDDNDDDETVSITAIKLM